LKRIACSVLLIALLALAVFAACKVLKTGWSITPYPGKPSVVNAAVKGTIVNGGKVLVTTAVVVFDVYRNSDNTKVAEMSASIDNLAPNQEVGFVARPPMVVEKSTNVNAAYSFRMRSLTERTSEK
jgi:hypothetical protein